jgi:hypothetical protein
LAIGQLDLGEDGPRRPWLGGMAEGFVAGDRAADLLAGFAVAAEIAERGGEVVASTSLPRHVFHLHVLIYGLTVERGSFL